MKTILKFEELMMFLLGIYLFSNTEFTWWWFPVLLLLPDVSMFGYLFGNKTGALVYNIFHHKGFAIFIYFIGVYFSLPLLELFGIILFSHSCLDRFLGYGLKYDKGFRYTHLGDIGENSSKD